ncbi:alpha/beta fold hydrolase [Niveispirillum sp. KHB5.9]|uniref:alpha/beta fold hydrolase n=1 Tax=Niveispirillum sp. KHB5.9 TaxID=3400269 RepID=UPI003A8664AE
MSNPAAEISPANRNVFVDHDYPEQSVDLGEVTMSYAVAGSPDKPALLLIPGQGHSWWAYEKAMAILEKDFQVYAVSLRGQGRSTWTPRRYTLDNMGNDLVRFISLVIKRPVITSGCSSGGVLSAWLSAFALPGQLRGALLEDPPLFASELTPLYGQGIRQAAAFFFEPHAKYLGDQWSVGNWAKVVEAIQAGAPGLKLPPEPPQHAKEYDPEWARSFVEGNVARNCPHELMLAQVKVPVLLPHHARMVDPKTGRLMGALSDMQAEMVREIVTKAGQRYDYASLPDAAHILHITNPPRFADVLTQWAKTLP